jgi:phosphoglycolate phosphatase
MQKKRAVLFDFDGTLADSIGIWIEVVEQLLKEGLGLKETVGRDELVGLRKEGIYQAIKKMGIPFYDLLRLVYKGRQSFCKRIDEVVPVRGIPDLIQWLKRENYLVGVVTSNSAECVRRFLLKNNMNVFDFMRCGVHLFGKKRVLEGAVRKLGLDRNEVIYVGDEIRDIEAAKDTGIKIIAVTWGFNTEDALCRFNPDYIARDPCDIRLIVSVLN